MSGKISFRPPLSNIEDAAAAAANARYLFMVMDPEF